MPSAAQSEWMNVMLEEIARKREEAELARRECELREAERASTTGPAGSGRPGSPAKAAQSRPRRTTRP